MALNSFDTKDSVYARVLRSRVADSYPLGLAIKPGARIAGKQGKGVRIDVVCAATGEDRGVRWVRYIAGGRWTVSKEEPK